MGLFAKKQPGGGDRLFELFAKGDAQAVDMVTKRRTEGVRDAEMVAFWNMSPRDHSVMTNTDNAFRTAVFLSNKDKGLDEEAAVDAVFKVHPRWGDPYDPEEVERGEDRSLYPELHDRINRYVKSHALKGRSEFQTRITAATTFNAFIRTEMDAGRL